jgi:hypothetical protein
MDNQWIGIMVGVVLAIPANVVAYFLCKRVERWLIRPKRRRLAVSTSLFPTILGFVLGTLLGVAAYVWGREWDELNRFYDAFFYVVVLVGMAITGGSAGFMYAWCFSYWPIGTASALLSLLLGLILTTVVYPLLVGHSYDILCSAWLSMMAGAFLLFSIRPGVEAVVTRCRRRRPYTDYDVPQTERTRHG